MSKTRLVSALAGSVCVLTAAAWFVTTTFPLSAAPQVVNDAPGVTVNIGGGALLHRAPVGYPEAARAKGVQGEVTLELTFDASGNVVDARALSGPEELRRPAIESALQWHFAHESAGNRRQVTIAFALPSQAAPSAAPATTETARGPQWARIPAPAPNAPARTERRIRSITIIGVTDEARSELMGKLALRVGDTLTADLLQKSARAVQEFDEHLRLVAGPAPNDEAAIVIMPRAAAEASGTPGRIKVGGNMQQTKLIVQPRPAYPPEAKAARVQGKVSLLAIIAKDGTVKNLEVISGDPMLIPSALEAVRQWVYQPTLLNGEPVEVQTQIDVNYTLSY